MGCGEFIVKYVLFFANLFFSLAGLALVGVGIAVQLKVSVMLDIIDQYNLSIAPIFAIIVGSIVFFVAFFGCCGAIRESNCMLVTYAIFMIILMVLKIALASLILVNLQSVLANIPNTLNEAFTRDPNSFSKTVEAAFQCCGTTGPNVYNTTLPDTCCATPPCSRDNAYGGCIDKITDFTSTFGDVIAFVAIVIAAIELVAVVFSLCLANAARNKERRSRY